MKRDPILVPSLTKSSRNVSQSQASHNSSPRSPVVLYQGSLKVTVAICLCRSLFCKHSTNKFDLNHGIRFAFPTDPITAARYSPIHHRPHPYEFAASSAPLVWRRGAKNRHIACQLVKPRTRHRDKFLGTGQLQILDMCL